MRVLDETPVDPNDPNVVGIAKFAVDERNKQAQTNFELVKVNAGGTEVILDGTVYQLNISVIESQVSTTRLVAILVHPDGSKELMSFE
uniref:Cystatin domain-containing protein n=1 Tax=Solanum tuberosum TaxID=4113 RepID=M1B358_SOLTU